MTLNMVALITGIIGFATAITIVILIRRDYLHVRYGLWWSGAAVAFVFLGLFPAFFDRNNPALPNEYEPYLKSPVPA